MNTMYDGRFQDKKGNGVKHPQSQVHWDLLKPCKLFNIQVGRIYVGLGIP